MAGHALLDHASSSRPEGVAPLDDGEQQRRLGRRTLLLHLAKQVPQRSGARSSNSSFLAAGVSRNRASAGCSFAGTGGASRRL